MAQKVVGYVRFQVPAGKATPAPPVGPALGQYGVNIAQSLPGRQPHPPLPRKNGSKKSFPSQAENWKMSCLVCLD